MPLAQQHLRNVLAYLDVPTLGQPGAFIQMQDGLFNDAGNNSRQFQDWMDRFITWVKKRAA